MITQTYNLNLIPNKVPVVVNASQYDKTSRTLKFNIYNDTELFTIPTGSTVTVRGTKPDKTGFEYSCSFSGSVVSVNIQQQMTIKSGKVPCEIRIVKGSEIIGTANFILDVEMTALADDTVISETDLPLLESAEEYAIRAETAAQQAEDTVANKMDYVSSPTANDILLTNSSGQAIDSGVKVADLIPIKISFSSFSSLPQTKPDSRITSDMEMIPNGFYLSNPSAMTSSEWPVAISNGSVTVSGSISGSTTLIMWLQKPR